MFYSLLCAALLLVAAGAAPGAEIGFAGMEMYKLDWDTQGLRIADVNGDGLNDIVVANNARARIECLLQRADPNAPVPPEELEVNELPDDRRFRKRSLITGKKIFGIALGDLNGDGRTDLAYYGDPRELAVHYQDEKGEWGTRRRFDIRDGATVPYGIEAADLNGDGRCDLALMATDGIYFIYQDGEGRLQAPVKDGGLPQGAVGMVSRDLDGDGRMDLIFLSTQEDTPFSFRLQTKEGGLGPEVGCRCPAVRSLALRDVNGDGRMEIASVQHVMGRLVLYELASETVPGALLEGPLERYALRASTARRAPAMAVGAFLDPARQDILVSDPDAAEMILYVQVTDGLWRRQESFPTLQGVIDAAPYDENGDGRMELLLLSPDEPMVGLARFDEHNQLQFPSALPLSNKPSCMAVGDLDKDGVPEVICCTVDGGREIHILAKGEEGFVERKKIVLKDPKTDPDGLLVADANQDGVMDILVFFPYQEMRVLKGTAEGEYVDVSAGSEYGSGFVRGLRKKAMALGDVDGDGRDEILVTSKNFARALKMDDKDRLIVIEQFNGRSAQSQINAVAMTDLDADGVAEMVLLDAGHRCLTALKLTADGTYEIVENMDVGEAGSGGIVPLALGAEKKPALLLPGTGDFRVLRPGAERTTLREIASYETPVRNGRLQLVEMSDLNGDGRPEFIATESSQSGMEILALEEDDTFKRLMSWPVFESRVFPGSDQPSTSEPREFEIGDVTNDGRPDIVLLVHDRVMVYIAEK
jgi:hypothetical protein